MGFAYVLKPCNYCGSTEVELMVTGTCTGPNAGREDYSPTCAACGATTNFYPTREEIKLGREMTNEERKKYVVDCWNRRYVPDDSEVKRRLTEACYEMNDAFYKFCQLVRK